VPYEPPAERRTDRRGAILRWSTFGLVALLVALLAYLSYVGYVGSEQVSAPGRSRDCRTPAHLGWAYEAVNYDIATDEPLADVDDPADCEAAGAPGAGDELVTPDGVSLAAWYIPAGHGRGPRAPTVILAHGHGMNKSDMLARARILHPEYHVVVFDFRNHGQSEDSATTVGLLEARDLTAVVDWLASEKRPSAIGVVGVSMGGAAALNAARGDERIDALVVESTHATLANALQARLERQGYPLSIPGAWAILLGGLLRTGEDMSAADPLRTIQGYGDRPLLLVAGGRDDTLGATDAEDLRAAARAGGADVTLRVCEDAGHAASPERCPGDYRAWMLGFFADALGG
jgi:pimeloyl-ACP methyl ester carboxylesterase